MSKDCRSIDDLVAEIEGTQLSTSTKRKKKRSPARAAVGSVDPGNPGASCTTLSAPDPDLAAAHADIVASEQMLPNLHRGALAVARERIAFVREEVASVRERPMSATRVKALCDRAAAYLIEKSLVATGQIDLLEKADATVASLELDAQVRASRQVRIAGMRRQWIGRRAELDREAARVQTEAVDLRRIQVFNVFMAYPSIENYTLLKRDPQVTMTSELTCPRKRLPEMTVTGFQKPQPDFLEAYDLTVTMTGKEGEILRAGTVVVHAHFAAMETDAAPTAAHFKNLRQALMTGDGVFRGTVSVHERASVISEIAAAAG